MPFNVYHWLVTVVICNVALLPPVGITYPLLHYFPFDLLEIIEYDNNNI